jgi:hypothetical protein
MFSPTCTVDKKRDGSLLNAAKYGARRCFWSVSIRTQLWRMEVSALSAIEKNALNSSSTRITSRLVVGVKPCAAAGAFAPSACP